MANSGVAICEGMVIPCASPSRTCTDPGGSFRIPIDSTKTYAARGFLPSGVVSDMTVIEPGADIVVRHFVLPVDAACAATAATTQPVVVAGVRALRRLQAGRQVTGLPTGL